MNDLLEPAQTRRPFLKVMDDEEEEGDGYELTPDQKKKAHSHLWEYAIGLMALVGGTLKDGIPTLVEQGARYGGSVDQVAMARVAHEVLLSQSKYVAGFKDDLRDGLEELLSSTWNSEAAYIEDVEAFMDAAERRAQMYVTGGGQPAWRSGVAGAAKSAGYPGGIWICTFVKDSCEDCQALHGEFLTWDDFEQTWGFTQCNGACLCGFVPADDPDGLSDEDMQEIDDSVEAF